MFYFSYEIYLTRTSVCISHFYSMEATAWLVNTSRDHYRWIQARLGSHAVFS